MNKKALVITSIAGDQHPILGQYAKECHARGVSYIVIGDKKSPTKFSLEHCDFLDIAKQQALPFTLAAKVPTGHYARKNLGYLRAILEGSTEIVETDDDNIPREEFWSEKTPTTYGTYIEEGGWVNAYAFFTERDIWPRGFPLEFVLNEARDVAIQMNEGTFLCPIQQGLADVNPDVDAVYRLTRPLPVSFEKKTRIILGRNSWSPFNSQNTHWFKEAFPLMYLPSYCSFRMTDIWRSYVAQRIAWECGWNILFHEPTVWQERNDHNLMKDFADEVVGYQNNAHIATALTELSLKQGKEAIFENLVLCYAKLIELELVGAEEMPLLEAWIIDLNAIR